MEKKERPKFPKGFFTRPRPTITMKEAIKDCKPFEWSQDVLSGNKKAIIVSAKKQ